MVVVGYVLLAVLHHGLHEQVASVHMHILA